MENKFIPLSESSSSGESSVATSTNPPRGHTGVIRVIRFDQVGLRMMTSGDDKRLLLWDCRTGKCIGWETLPKKVSAGRIAPDGRLVVADKTGDAYGLEPKSLQGVPNESDENGNCSEEKTGGNRNASKSGVKDDDSGFSDNFLLGHCSTVTDLEFLTVGKGKYVVSSDVEKKIRISKYPNAHTIETFCFGHTSFVTRLDRASFETQDGAKIPLLLSGGGDGTVRLWEPSTGRLLHTYRDGLSTNSNQSQIAAPVNVENPSKAEVSVSAVMETEKKTSTAETSKEESKKPETKLEHPTYTEAKNPVIDLSVSRWQNLTAVYKLGEKKIETLRVTEGTLRPHSTISLDHTPLAIAFDPQAHLWVVVDRVSEGIGVEVYGLSGDELSMKRMEINDTLKQTLFPNVDRAAMPLIHEYLRAHVAKSSRKKMRLSKTLEEPKPQPSA